MADAIVQVSPDSTGAKIDNESLTVGAQTVMRQRGMIAGSGAAELARVLAATPAPGDYGLVTRPQQNSRKVSGALGAVNDAVTIACDGVGDIFVDVDAGTLAATIQVEATTDDTNWFGINFMDANGGIYGSSGAPFRGYMQTNAYSQVRVRVSSYTSGTANARLVGKMGGAGIVRLAHSLVGGTGDANALTNAIVAGAYGYNGASWDRLRSTIANGLAVDVTRHPALTKGTQGATGISTQNLVDAGRNAVHFHMTLPIVTTATDALQSLTGYKSGAAVAATTTPAVITAGKTYRITAITITYVAVVTAGSVKFTLRVNLSGVVAIGSPAVAAWVVGGPAAVAGVANTVDIAIPDGMEFPAAAGIGVSMVGLGATQAAAAVGYGAIAINGFEY